MKFTRTILFLSSAICLLSSLIIAIFNDSFNIHGPAARIFIILAAFYSMLVICLFLIIGLYFIFIKKDKIFKIDIYAMLLGIVSVGLQFIVFVTV